MNRQHFFGDAFFWVWFNFLQEGGVWAPLYYILMPWRSREVHDREYELTDAASNFPWPDDLNVMIEFELTRRQGDIDYVDNDDSDGDDFLSRAR